MTDIDNTSPALSDKQILADPVSLFVRLYPDGRDVEKAQLQLLQQQHAELKKRQKELQLQSKKVSRQIKFVNKVIKRIRQNESLITVRFDRIRSMCFRIIKFWVPTFPAYIYIPYFFSILLTFRNSSGLGMAYLNGGMS